MICNESTVLYTKHIKRRDVKPNAFQRNRKVVYSHYLIIGREIRILFLFCALARNIRKYISNMQRILTVLKSILP